MGNAGEQVMPDRLYPPLEDEASGDPERDGMVMVVEEDEVPVELEGPVHKHLGDQRNAGIEP